MNNSLRIGFIDYRPDVGHASSFLQRIRNRRDSHGCEVIAINAMVPEIGRDWAKTKSLPYFDRIEDFQGNVDGIIIPAASNPEHHLELLQRCAGLGVPVFMDKPLAPDAATGAKIFTLAREKNIPFFSASALRFADEVKELRELTPLMVQAWGAWGEKFDEYVIHPIETAISLLGPGIQSVRRSSIGARHHIELLYPEGRRGDVYFWPGAQPYEVTVCGNSECRHRAISSPFFERLFDRIFTMIESRQVAVAERDTLAVLKAIDACRASENGDEIPIIWNGPELN